jgi:hypothetical protein
MKEWKQGANIKINRGRQGFGSDQYTVTLRLTPGQFMVLRDLLSGQHHSVVAIADDIRSFVENALARAIDKF